MRLLFDESVLEGKPREIFQPRSVLFRVVIYNIELFFLLLIHPILIVVLGIQQIIPILRQTRIYYIISNLQFSLGEEFFLFAIIFDYFVKSDD